MNRFRGIILGGCWESEGFSGLRIYPLNKPFYQTRSERVGFRFLAKHLRNAS